MRKSLFSRDQWPLAQKLAGIVYCNPFEEERWRLERDCLGSAYQERALYIAPGEQETLLAPNIAALLEIGVGLMESARSRLSGGAEATPQELSVYENLMHFVVYHECMREFDALIEKSLAGRPSSGDVPFYYTYRDRQRHFMAVSPATRLSPATEALNFALYFQLRRAWLNIYRYLVGSSPAISRLRARIWNSCFSRDMERYRRSLYDRLADIATLITGPSGSGKELVARAVGMSRFVPFDEASGRFVEDFAAGFFPLNLSALSPTLVESELFGHRKGSFTGALSDREGYFESCGRYGAVFLDEVGEADAAIQVKLLRVLQTRSFQRLGDTRPRPFAGKVMAATNRDLWAEMQGGAFREDFFYRLCSDRIQTPSLREIVGGSSSELELLTRHIALRVAGPEAGPALTGDACRWIVTRLGMAYEWPGNFRELEQCVRSIMIQGEYTPLASGRPGALDSLTAGAKGKPLSANQLLSRYAQELYRESPSYEEIARMLQVDRRTAKRYVLGVD